MRSLAAITAAILAGLVCTPAAGQTATGNTYTVQSNSTRLLGNVRVSYVDFPTAAGPRPAIQIDADRVVLDNLHVRFPGQPGGFAEVWQRTGDGRTTTLNGNFRIVIARLTATPEIAGLASPEPVTVDAAWAPDDVAEHLKEISLDTPDEVSEQLVMRDGSMETYYISADDIRFDEGTSIGL